MLCNLKKEDRCRYIYSEPHKIAIFQNFVEDECLKTPTRKRVAKKWLI